MAELDSPAGSRSLSLSEWPALDDLALPEEKRTVFRRRQLAVQAYARGESLSPAICRGESQVGEYRRTYSVGLFIQSNQQGLIPWSCLHRLCWQAFFSPAFWSATRSERSFPPGAGRGPAQGGMISNDQASDRAGEIRLRAPSGCGSMRAGEGM